MDIRYSYNNELFKFKQVLTRGITGAYVRLLIFVYFLHVHYIYISSILLLHYRLLGLFNVIVVSRTFRNL
jgi:hypothetical protein